MQAIARDFGLPETVFVFPPGEPAHTARVRIFTPAAELPFAGHPTVGCAALLALLRSPTQPTALILEEKIGPVRCHVTPQGEDLAHARFDLPVLPRKLEWTPDTAAVAAALGLARSDVDDARFPLEKWSAGVDVFMVAVKATPGLGLVRPEVSRWESAFGKSGPRIVYVFAPYKALPAKAYAARMFAPLLGVHEDPATGSAAAAFAGLLTDHGRLGSGSHDILIEQGREMGRRSAIKLHCRSRTVGWSRARSPVTPSS
jgi:trans-2,3-dihydro-3-hydroxyanthranilate isomerase